VIIDQHINNGLTFSLQQTDRASESKAIFTKDKDNNISLTFQYSGLNCSVTLADKPTSYELKFHFPFLYLDNYFSKHPENYYHQFSDNETQDICCNKQLILHEIINCKMQGAYRQMFLESKALGLLLCFQKCNTKPQNDCASCKFLVKPVEKEKIYKAKEIILSRLNNPLTIPELSLEVGINQCYLKKGFKEIFGITVYDFVQEQRMLKAKLLLTTTDFTVSQVADEIGFSSMSNFSSAFKKHTGVFPSELQKTVA
jgi:AraC-like DNA-binding protein